MFLVISLIDPSNSYQVKTLNDSVIDEFYNGLCDVYKIVNGKFLRFEGEDEFKMVSERS